MLLFVNSALSLRQRISKRAYLQQDGVQNIICIKIVIFLINHVGRVSQPHVFIHVVTQFRSDEKDYFYEEREANVLIEAYVRHV